MAGRQSCLSGMERRVNQIQYRSLPFAVENRVCWIIQRSRRFDKALSPTPNSSDIRLLKNPTFPPS